MNDPVNNTDPTGYITGIEVAIIVGAISLGVGLPIVTQALTQLAAEPSHLGPGPTAREVRDFNSPSGSQAPSTGGHAPRGPIAEPGRPPLASVPRDDFWGEANRAVAAVNEGLHLASTVALGPLGHSIDAMANTIGLTAHQLQHHPGLGEAFATAVNANYNPMWGAAESIYKAREASLQGKTLEAWGYGLKAAGQTAMAAGVVAGGVGAAGGGGGGNIVYRGLAAGENPAAGLIARAPDAANSVASHVAGARASQWISTTRSLEVATNRFGPNGVVAIDLSRVGSPIVDLTRGIPGIGPNTMLSRWAINAQEVLIQGRIPAEAIVPLR